MTDLLVGTYIATALSVPQVIPLSQEMPEWASEIADKLAASLVSDLELDRTRMKAARTDECSGTNFAYTTFPPRYVVLDCTCGQCNK